MERGLQGTYRITTYGEETVRAFIPAALPPTPPIEWDTNLQTKYEEALFALGRLDGVAEFVPDPSLFLYMYVRKEAVLSSMIEGTQSSIADLMMYELDEAPGSPLEDAEAVSTYVSALMHGIGLLDDGLPISLRLIKEVHGVLLKHGRGHEQQPGAFRRTQNWIGGTRPGNAAFVPPPPDMVMDCMGALELFIHDQPVATPPLVKAALVHAQFETIHPFLDGNGRLGRLLITLLLYAQGLLSQPLLYVSLYFKTHRQDYYTCLDRVRTCGDWEGWLAFFADAVITSAHQAVNTTKRLSQLIMTDQTAIKELGRRGDSALRVYQALLRTPITPAHQLAEASALTIATTNKALNTLHSLGIVEEITGQQRNRIYRYSTYLNLLSEGTDLPPG